MAESKNKTQAASSIANTATKNIANKLLMAFLALAAITAGLGLTGLVPSNIFFALRWTALGVLLIYGTQKRSLTAWILIGMVVGAEIGHDFPAWAINLRVLSLIFLRLIKTIT